MFRQLANVVNRTAVLAVTTFYGLERDLLVVPPADGGVSLAMPSKHVLLGHCVDTVSQQVTNRRIGLTCVVGTCAGLAGDESIRSFYRLFKTENIDASINGQRHAWLFHCLSVFLELTVVTAPLSA